VFGPDNELTYIIDRVEDVTELVRFKRPATKQRELADELIPTGQLGDWGAAPGDL